MELHCQIILHFYRIGSVKRYNFKSYITQNLHILLEESLNSQGVTDLRAVIKSGVLSYDISNHTITGDKHASILIYHTSSSFSSAKDDGWFFSTRLELLQNFVIWTKKFYIEIFPAF